MNWKICLLVVSAMVLGPLSLAHATNGMLQIGYGVKSKGMGGVGIALPQDSFASALNPAGMSLLCDRFDVGLNWLHQHAEFSTAGGMNPLRGKSGEDLWWPEVGFNRMVCCNQSFGFAVYVGGEWDVHYKTLIDNASATAAPSKSLLALTDTPLPPRRQAPSTLKAAGVDASPIPAPSLGLYQFVVLSPVYSWQITTCHSVGIAINATVGKIRLDSQEITDSVAPAFTIDRGNDYQWGIGARFGWLGQFGCGIQVGATYQTRTYMSHFRKYRGIIPDGGDADLPAQFGVGVAWQPFCRLILSADAVKIFWREGKFFRNAFDDGSGPFGARSGPGLGWDEQVVFKFGLAWNVIDCLTLRLGYNHGNCPIPRGNLFDVITADTLQDHGTVGFTWHWRCHQISFVYLHAFTNTIKGPEPIDPDSFLILKGRQDSVGIEYGYRF